MYSAARSSPSPPISPIISTARVSGSAWKALKTSRKLEAGHRVAPDTDAGGLTDALLRQLVQSLVGQVRQSGSRPRRARPQGQCRRR